MHQNEHGLQQNKSIILNVILTHKSTLKSLLNGEFCVYCRTIRNRADILFQDVYKVPSHNTIIYI